VFGLFEAAGLIDDALVRLRADFAGWTVVGCRTVRGGVRLEAEG
jgi:hypothetical protein